VSSATSSVKSISKPTVKSGAALRESVVLSLPVEEAPEFLKQAFDLHDEQKRQATRVMSEANVFLHQLADFDSQVDDIDRKIAEAIAEGANSVTVDVLNEKKAKTLAAGLAMGQAAVDSCEKALKLAEDAFRSAEEACAQENATISQEAFPSGNYGAQAAALEAHVSRCEARAKLADAYRQMTHDKLQLASLATRNPGANAAFLSTMGSGGLNASLASTLTIRPSQGEKAHEQDT